MGSSDQLSEGGGITWKELMENSRIAVPVIYRGIVTSLSKLSEVKQRFHTFSEAAGQKCTQAQQGRLSLPHLGRLDGWKADHPEASSQHVWHLDEVAVTIDRWSPCSLPMWPGLFRAQRLSFQKEHSQRGWLESKCPKSLVSCKAFSDLAQKSRHHCHRILLVTCESLRVGRGCVARSRGEGI